MSFQSAISVSENKGEFECNGIKTAKMFYAGAYCHRWAAWHAKSNYLIKQCWTCGMTPEANSRAASSTPG